MDVARQAGHSNTRLVESTYGHPDERKARARLKDLDDSQLSDEQLGRLAAGE
jgi:hypothetical protein